MTIILDNDPPSTLQGVGLGGGKNLRIIIGENISALASTLSAPRVAATSYCDPGRHANVATLCLLTPVLRVLKGRHLQEQDGAQMPQETRALVAQCSATLRPPCARHLISGRA